MQANPRSVSELFNSQLRYVVPMFQRLYVWQQSPQWKTLWEDVVEKATLRIAEKDTNPHYLGALIIEGVKPTSPREVKRFLVIDGQQRLTTLQLLLCAFRDLARVREWKSIDKPLSRYLENADPDVMEKPDEEVFKLWPTTLNRDIFKSVLTSGSKVEVEKKHPLVYIGRKRKPEIRSNLVEAYLYFSGQIATWIDATAKASEKDAETVAFTLLQAMQEDFSVVEITLSEGDDSQEIFYSLNSQGRPLSQSDLLRSLIFMRAEKEKQNRDKIFDEYWSKFETPFWSGEIKRAGRTYSRLDLGLRYFLIAKTGQQVDARRVNEEYRHWISSKPPKYASVRDELADFVRHGDAYARYESLLASKLPATDLRRVLADFDVSTALPLVMFLELEAGMAPEQLGQCLGMVESFIARRVFLNDENREYNKFFVEVVGSLIDKRGDQVAPALRSKLLAGGGGTRRWPTDQDVIEHAISQPLYNVLKTPALRLILERVELSQRNKKTEKMEVEPNLQIEHVMPQKWWTHWPLQGKTIPQQVGEHPFYADMANLAEFKELGEPIRQRNRVVHMIGNLSLVNGHLNPAGGNAGFPVKLEEYRNSVLRLNRYFSEFKEWDEQAIATRSKLLGEAICSIWPR
ncbi:DUF262 domain-containing protein [Paracidovorax avenae]|uniref:DUF262 domain-containing protein n=1 Tax=Paracidovorax avenae TaxID=80867 RepID=UPI000D220E40|nr:DUF262 domain-containing protein [Paracidovorax avenae]AVT01633.1 hypothetical protein C8243_03360 [Paracidovorax avenae]